MSCLKSDFTLYSFRYSYETFSHLKSVLRRDYNLIGETLGAPRFPPYSQSKTEWISRLIKSRSVQGRGPDSCQKRLKSRRNLQGFFLE